MSLPGSLLIPPKPTSLGVQATNPESPHIANKSTHALGKEKQGREPTPPHAAMERGKDLAGRLARGQKNADCPALARVLPEPIFRKRPSLWDTVCSTVLTSGDTAMPGKPQAGELADTEGPACSTQTISPLLPGKWHAQATFKARHFYKKQKPANKAAPTQCTLGQTYVQST